MQKGTFGLLFGLVAAVGMTGMTPPAPGREAGHAVMAVEPAPLMPASELRWMTLQQAEENGKSEPRVIIMDIYTDWCYWCKVMERNTYSNPALAAYVAGKFYPVKFNAESHGPVSWKGQSFGYNSDYKVNELALNLTRGQLSFPTTVIITPDDQAPQFISGYLKPAEIEPILKYFGEGVYKKESYSVFKRTFKSEWK